MPQLTLDTAVLETLLKRAMSAARRISYIEDGLYGPSDVDLLADDIDAIIHELTETLGNPHLIATSVPDACSTFAADGVMRTGRSPTSLGEWFCHRRTARTVRERDGPDSLAPTQRILRSVRALRQGLRRQRKAT